jgi:hypothetical protein
MGTTWALIAVGAGPDEGRSWLLATGSRDDVADRALLARMRYADTGSTARLTFRIAALALVPADHPSARRAARDVQVMSLASLPAAG